MRRILNFFHRNLKEIFLDPIIYVFCLGFPLIMLILFQVINNYTHGNTPMFELGSLLPAIIMFSFTFVMLIMALLVSKDKSTFFLKRLYSSPMKSYQFVLGYASVGLFIGILQIVICIVSALIISLITKVSFPNFGQIILLSLSQLPMLITFTFLGILFGVAFSDKSAPGLCSVVISLAGVLGGCWMPIESMGEFAIFCRCLPFYPSVILGRITTGASNAFGIVYQFDYVARLGLIPLLLFALAGVIASFVAFKKNMVSDN